MPMMSYYFSKHQIQFQSWQPWQWWVLIGLWVAFIVIGIISVVKLK